MIGNLRRTLFFISALFFRIPIWVIIWLVGRTGVIKTVFVIYPHNKKEYSNLSPDFPFFLKFLSGRPTPGGCILDGWKPVGIYLFIPNTPQELSKKKNRHIAEAIARRMRWIQKISGAKACGFAGQLGPILEKRHNIAMKPPFFCSTMGNIFSIDDSIAFLSKNRNKPPWQVSICLVGGGELAEKLQEHFITQGYRAEIVHVTYKRRGGFSLKKGKTDHSLDNVDFVVNLLPTGEDFLQSGATDFLTDSATILDFSRPPIPSEKLSAKVFMGNRVQRPGMRFAFALPGWQREELPACSIPSILASYYGIIENNVADFCVAARQVAFETALGASAQQSLTIKLDYSEVTNVASTLN